MNITQALLARKSVRAFLSKPVSRDKIERILTAARHAPSGTNTQPWQVAVVSGDMKKNIEQQLLAAANANETPNMDYLYYPVEWVEPYRARRKACGLQMYSTLGINREDKEKQRAQWHANYSAFGAPVVLYFFMDAVMEKGSYIDYGMFLQSVMLAALDEGLTTCAQAALAQYPHIVKQALGFPDECVMLCGMALGFEDESALVNSYRTPRAEVKAFARFYE